MNELESDKKESSSEKRETFEMKIIKKRNKSNLNLNLYTIIEPHLFKIFKKHS